MRVTPTFLLVVAVLLAGSAPPPADDLQAARSALRTGDTIAAAAAVDRFLAGNPQDPGGRFLKGVILNEQGRSSEAFDVFFALTQEHPELPEPYNNLAVLYAARGEYEPARRTLEMAIRVNPNYATAYENLGDIHIRLAVQAYERSIHIADTRSVRAKLRLARDLTNARGLSAAPQ